MAKIKTTATLLHTFEQMADAMIKEAIQHKTDTGEDYVIVQLDFGNYLMGVVNDLKSRI